MPRGIDRFLSQRTRLSKRATLGRVFNVTCETWRLTDDPQEVRPQLEVVATGRTAGEAADIARETAVVFSRHGFHKPSRAWWGADDGYFHRYVVHGPRPRPFLALFVVSGLAAGAALTLARRPRSRKP